MYGLIATTTARKADGEDGLAGVIGVLRRQGGDDLDLLEYSVAEVPENDQLGHDRGRCGDAGDHAMGEIALAQLPLT